MKIKFLKAFNGDSILISFLDNQENNRNILIDGGTKETYKSDKGPKGKPIEGELKIVVDQIRSNNEYIDILILTHIDDDHIAGILKWFSDDEDADKLIKEVWFNSGGLIAEWQGTQENKNLELFIVPQKTTLTSVRQAIEFGKYIGKKGIWNKRVIVQGDTLERFGLVFKILSPNKSKLEKLLKEWKREDPELKTAAKQNDYSKSLIEHIQADVFEEDKAPANGSSLDFILTFNEKDILFLGDSHPSVVIEGLAYFGFSPENPLRAEMVKVSHHGSKGNTNSDCLQTIECTNYVISTDGSKYEHPHKQFLARLINVKNNCNIFFTEKKRMELIFSKDDKKDFPSFYATALTTEFEL